MENQRLWSNNKSAIERCLGRSARLLFLLLTNCSTLESLCYVQTVGSGNVILSSVHTWLTTLKAFTCTQPSSLNELCAKQRNCGLDKGIHCSGNWETIGFRSKRWYSWLRENEQIDGKEFNGCILERLQSQKACPGVYMNLSDNNYHTQYRLYHLSRCAEAVDKLCNIVPRTTCQDRQF